MSYFIWNLLLLHYFVIFHHFIVSLFIVSLSFYCLLFIVYCLFLIHLDSFHLSLFITLLFIYALQIRLSFDFATISELNMQVLISQNNWVEALQHVLNVILALQMFIFIVMLYCHLWNFILSLICFIKFKKICHSWKYSFLIRAFTYYARALMYASISRFGTTSIRLLCQDIDVHQQ